MADARLEFLVEPFVMHDPGTHVRAAVQVVADAGLEPDMGPFATTATGEIETIIETVGDLIRAGFEGGATSVQLSIDTTDHVRRGQLHTALDRLLADVEREIGTPLAEMTRDEKQRAVQRLDANGAFLLRGSVEDVASTIGVSRVTLYAYLNAVGR